MTEQAGSSGSCEGAIGEEELRAFGVKLAAWAAGLTFADLTILQHILQRAAASGEVGGYTLEPNPAFVFALIQGTFQATVDASIQQMQAYGELLKQAGKAGPTAARHWPP